MAKIYEQFDVTVAATKEGTVDAFTSTTEVPRTLKIVWSIEKTAANDLLVFDDRENIADVPCDMLPSTDDKLIFDRKIKVGHIVRVGFRTVAGIAAKYIVVVSEIPD